MMGFVAGFTGGVTLTLSLAYLSVLNHQRTRDEQRRCLAAQALALQSFADPLPPPPPPSRSEAAAAQREALTEVVKDRWNEEVQKAARLILDTDWEEVREDLEARAASLWTRAFGESAEAVDKAAGKLQPLARQAKATAGEMGGSVAAAARGAFDRAKETGERLESTVADKALEARLAGRRGALKADSEARETAAEAKGVVVSALQTGRDQAQTLASKVKSAMGLAGDKAADGAAATADVAADVAAAAAAAAAGDDNGTLSPVQKALQQRYKRPGAAAERGVAEVLRERYRPMGERDNTVLRGL